MDSLGEFVFHATDTTVLKAEVAAKCETALAKLGDSWKGYHQVGVSHFLDEKHPVQIYNKSFGKKGGANSSHHILMNTDNAPDENDAINDLGIYSHWSVCSKPDAHYYSEDLNSGCGGKYIYLVGWKALGLGPITDVICLYSESGKDENFQLVYNGRTYKMVKACYKYFTLDCNYGAGGPYLYLMYTRDDYDDRYLYLMSTELRDEPLQTPNEEDIYTLALISQISKFTVPSVDVNGNKRSDCADLNEGAGGDYVYLHQYYKHN